jgi:hypothetical protein
MSTFRYSAAFFLLIPLASVARSAPPDSTVASRRHLLTLHTLHIRTPFIPALGYEASVRPRWGVRASLGANHNSNRYSSSYYNAAGLLIVGTTHYRYTSLLTDASLNYYLQARKQALIGWFVGVGFIAGYTYRRVTNDSPSFPTRTSHDVAVRPLLRGGRHWTLGQRWLLDTHVAVAISSYPTQRIALNELLGVGAGYRF